MRRVSPAVFLIGESRVDGSGLKAYLDHIGTDWRPDHTAASDGEIICEVYGRACYRSWEPGMNPNVRKIRAGNNVYIGNILKSRHGSVIEHPVQHWVLADISRVATHEIVRHRAGCAFSQESLRFVRLTDLGLWLPPEVDRDPKLVALFEKTFRDLENLQSALAVAFNLDGESIDFARKKSCTSAMRRVAPIGLATTLGMTTNFRSLRHIIEMRTAESAEAELRVIWDLVARVAKERWPNIFQDFAEPLSGGPWKPEYSKV
jgi:thymidylate synthase (FAD)